MMEKFQNVWFQAKEVQLNIYLKLSSSYEGLS